MNRPNQNTTATFAEVLTNAGVSCQHTKASGNDNRLMMYFQGIKLYIPDGVQCETLLTALRAMKQL